ncbi:hypothetical protein MFU01_82230 [Myxococcus fulvus]|uniref:ORC1/DEAH AAA+ ATPase domain-containing protein n=1 Tax=Myxococcus fulvus TaxID=33 RepID=A0A511TG87_MYXFU|nr:AAA family ATPase [Myxococcus fulvus]GEN13186.1 hypothetical protein MFU01_82230 [Myxococcus fulvus]
MVVVPGEVQARDLSAAFQVIQHDTKQRLDPDLIVVASDWQNLESRLEQIPAARERCIAWQFENQTGPTDRDATGLSQVLGARLATHDIFDERDPVRGRHVIGRRDEIRALTRQVIEGKSVGLFGLRKVGKTTLIRKVTDDLDPHSIDTTPLENQINNNHSRALVFFTDTQDITEMSLERVLALLCRKLCRRLSLEGISVSAPQHPSMKNFERILDKALGTTNLPLCLVIDEYDYLYEPVPIRGLSILLRLLRAKAQETRRLALVIAGRDPGLFQAPKLEGMPNPVMGWFQETWIGPFDKDSANEALKKLGRRVGLDVGPETLNTAFEWTRGHPMLHRQFGSALWHLLRKGRRTIERPATDAHLEEAKRVFREKEAARVICQEISALLSERYQDAFDLLSYLAENSPDMASQFFDWHGGYEGESSLILRRFGLVSGTQQEPEIPQLLRWYLKSRRA